MTNMRPSGLYVHIPFCSGKCLYCAFYSVGYKAELASRLLKGLTRELDMLIEQAGPFEPATIYIGGGTPTQLSEGELEALCAGICSRVNIAGVKEWTIEANPETLTAEKLKILSGAGVNRVSMGVQSSSDDTLSMLGRRHTWRDACVAVDLVRESGIENLGMDVIACVPGTGMDGWKRTLHDVVKLVPKHLSVYALTVEEGSRLSEAVASGELLVEDDEHQLESIHYAESILSDAGYSRYEISNYAQEGYECLHNLSCWRGDRYVAIGPSASSYVGMDRWTNAADVEEYLAALESGGVPPRETESLSADTVATDMLVFGLRTWEGVDLGDVVARSGVDGCREKKWVELLHGLSESGLVANRDTRWILTSRGRDLADYVAAELLG